MIVPSGSSVGNALVGRFSRLYGYSSLEGLCKPGTKP